jgi:hypothetical protein
MPRGKKTPVLGGVNNNTCKYGKEIAPSSDRHLQFTNISNAWK